MITMTQVAEEIRRLATDNPERKAYCQYIERNHGELRPDCIVGHAVVNLGLATPKHLHTMENTSASEVLQKLNVEWDDTLSNWINEVQSRQDGDWPWAMAVELADREMEFE
jgi:acetylornithine/succinyldiaminopimelate/putrescine aminotransferase